VSDAANGQRPAAPRAAAAAAVVDRLLDRVEAGIEAGAVDEAARMLGRAAELLAVEVEAPRALARAAWLAAVISLTRGQRGEFERRSKDAIAALRLAGANDSAARTEQMRSGLLALIAERSSETDALVAPHLKGPLRDLRRMLEAHGTRAPVLLVARQGAGKRVVARGAAAGLGRLPFELEVDCAAEGRLGRDAAGFTNALAEARHMHGLVYLRLAGAYELGAELAFAVADAQLPCIVGADTQAAAAGFGAAFGATARITLPSIPLDAQPAAWAEALRQWERAAPPPSELETHACTPGLVPGEIEAAVALAIVQTPSPERPDETITAPALWRALEEHLVTRIDYLADRLEPIAASNAAADEAFTALHRRSAGRRGFVIALHGPDPDARKLAATALGARLELPIYRLDLAHLSEIEPARARSHIDELMQLAEWFSAVLFLDPSDALRGPHAYAEPGPAAAALGAHLAMTELTVVLSGESNAPLPPSIAPRINCMIRVGDSR